MTWVIIGGVVAVAVVGWWRVRARSSASSPQLTLEDLKRRRLSDMANDEEREQVLMLMCVAAMRAPVGDEAYATRIGAAVDRVCDVESLAAAMSTAGKKALVTLRDGARHSASIFYDHEDYFCSLYVNTWRGDVPTVAAALRGKFFADVNQLFTVGGSKVALALVLHFCVREVPDAPYGVSVDVIASVVPNTASAAVAAAGGDGFDVVVFPDLLTDAERRDLEG